MGPYKFNGKTLIDIILGVFRLILQFNAINSISSRSLVIT